MTKPMTAVSLFSGVGGFEIALNNLKVEVVASVEIDDHARGVLQYQFINQNLFNDVREVTADDLFQCGFDPDNGIIVGGFPCQDLSVAGKQAGLAGERSGLFWEIHRLLKETKAKYFIIENVAGLLSSNKGRDMGIVLGALGDLGYGVAYRILDAQHFGVPQRRRRVFLVGCLGDDGRTPAEILSIAEGSVGYSPKSRKKREDAPTTVEGSALARMQGFGDYEIDSISSALKARDWKDSTDLVFSADENKIILFDGIRSGDPRVSDDELVPTVTARWGTGGNNVPMVHNPEVTPIQDARGVEKKQNGLGIGSLGDPAYTVDTVSHQAVAVHAYDEYNDSIADTHHTLRAGTKQSTGVLTASTVRRLTPLECERLQGFPDNWTLNRWDFKKSEEYKQSDSSRYKQMGNAVAVPVVQWIAERLLAFHNR